MKRLFITLICLAATVFSVSCNKAKQPTPATAPAATAAKRYHLKGEVVSVDKQSKMLSVDSEAIPDFMSAMTMPYQVKPESQLDRLKSGDAITADVVVQDDKSWLENIAVTGHSAAGKSQ